MFNEFNRARFNDGIRAFLGMDSQTPAPTVAPEVTPTLGINQMDDASLRYLRAERLVSGTAAQVAPGVGNTNKVSLNNRLGSGLLVTVNSASIWTDVGGDIYFELLQGSAAGTLAGPCVNDTRWLSQIPAAEMNFVADAVPVPAVSTRFSRRESINSGLGNTIRVIPVSIVIHPGWRLRIAHVTAVTPIFYVTLEWSERSLGQLET